MNVFGFITKFFQAMRSGVTARSFFGTLGAIDLFGGKKPLLKRKRKCIVFWQVMQIAG